MKNLYSIYVTVYVYWYVDVHVMFIQATYFNGFVCSRVVLLRHVSINIEINEKHKNADIW